VTKVKIFIGLKAPRGDNDLCAASLVLAEAVRATGHEPFVAWREIEEQGFSPQQFMPFVREHLRTCDLLLVLYHPELRGGLIELGDRLCLWDSHLAGAPKQGTGIILCLGLCGPGAGICQPGGFTEKDSGYSAIQRGNHRAPS
jgi:hypothetical protein